MIPKSQIAILDAIKRGNNTVKLIKDHLKSKSQSLIPNNLKILEKEKLITKQTIGNNNIYNLQYKNHLVYNYLEIFSWENLSKESKISLSRIIEKINDPIMVFGSYAKKKPAKDSDLDIVILSDDENIEKEIEDTKLKSIIELDIHIIKRKDFKEMLQAPYENLGKEIMRNNLPISNSKEFYSLALANHQPTL